ncbi:MAG TPA: hypothetical protein VG733_19020 [Chthoniobacteraceae bacterium]|nr:hypothetical protein [Chthoniobacteraceae bacterium]
MKAKLSLVFAALVCAGGLLPATARADDYRDGPMRHLTWVHRHFIWRHHHRVFWVPGHPGIR